jgi:hypothetical protein
MFISMNRIATPMRWALSAVMIGALSAPHALAQAPRTKSTFPFNSSEMMAAREDVWAEASLRQPNGASYEFFKDLLPPLRYANTEFRHYPIVLSAPLAPVKARWISNGSAVNARANKKPMWREVGLPVRFLVGDKSEPFGADFERVDGPRYVEGYLPIVRISYTVGKARYEQEAFASVRGPLADHGAILLRFTTRDGAGAIAAHIDAEGPLATSEGCVRDAQGRGLVLFGEGWLWDGEKKELHAKLEADHGAVLAVLTQPLPQSPRFSAADYEAERKACVETWQALLRRGTQLDIPEPLVQDAWRALVVGNYLIAVGDRMHYSAGNAYDHLYEGECGDAVRALMLLGHTDDARKMVGPLLDFQRQATRYHVAGHKLQLLTHYYWVTRDAEYLKLKENVWKPVVEFIISSRQKENGLLPKDNYAGDINQQVYSLNSNANCWRGLRDMAAVLDDVGDTDEAKRLAREAGSFRKAILDAVAKSEHKDVKPSFIPMALFGDEGPHDPLTATRIGSYYDLMAPYVLGSGIFSPNSEREEWMIDYLRQHGGLAMGMIRSTPQQGEFNGETGVNVLYGLRYQLAVLRRDDRDHALAGFYGHLAHGMTRDTFVGGEGSRFFHGDKWGRSFYLPPNSASNAMFLTTLRYLLVQDWDLDDDGKPETLRLLYGAPGHWFRDGAVLRVERAPTAFGELSLRVESHLSRGEVLATIDALPRRPVKTLLRLPLPAGWKVVSATVAGQELRLGPGGAVELPERKDRFAVRLGVESTKK